MTYYLQLNLLFHEMSHGPVRLRDDVLPADPARYVDRPEMDENAKEIVRRMKKIYDEFVASLNA